MPPQNQNSVPAAPVTPTPAPMTPPAPVTPPPAAPMPPTPPVTTTPAPVSSGHSSNWGAIIGIVIVVLLLAAGGAYFFYMQSQHANAVPEVPVSTTPETPAANPNSTNESDIQADLNAAASESSAADVNALQGAL